jgi:exodeoxyribonuclease V beta subunit
VLTVHASKGLQFPVVYLPEAWDTHVPDDDGTPLLLHEHGDGSPGDCLLDVGGLTGPGRRERLRRTRTEEAGEDLRLLYVALTRAQCQVVAWWAASRSTPGSALHRFLCRDRSFAGDEAASAEPEPTYPVDRSGWRLPPDDSVAVEDARPRDAVPWQGVTQSPTPLAVRTFTRTLDTQWRRTSYSALTAAAHGLDIGTPAVGSEPDVPVDDDEPGPTGGGPGPGPDAPDADRGSAPGRVAGLDRPSPMADLPMGPEFGTVVHGILEKIDPGADDLAAALLPVAAEALAHSSISRGDRSRGPVGNDAALSGPRLASAIVPTLLTPLGPIAGDRSLADIGAADRLAELDFELPLAGGDRPRAEVSLRDIADLLAGYLEAKDPLADYPARLLDPLLSEQALRGFLTGSIDAVLRLREASGPRYVIVDYKTNWLGAYDGPALTLGAYTPDRLARAMMAAHYPLQALLYSVALHRLLRWRQPGYAPERHLGGIAYLFVRGMAGPEPPRIDGVPCGVFGRRPPDGLVPDLSDLLDRGVRR